MVLPGFGPTVLDNPCRCGKPILLAAYRIVDPHQVKKSTGLLFVMTAEGYTGYTLLKQRVNFTSIFP